MLKNKVTLKISWGQNTYFHGACSDAFRLLATLRCPRSCRYSTAISVKPSLCFKRPYCLLIPTFLIMNRTSLRHRYCRCRKNSDIVYIILTLFPTSIYIDLTTVLLQYVHVLCLRVLYQRYNLSTLQNRKQFLAILINCFRSDFNYCNTTV
jgi:hypothetical protein